MNVCERCDVAKPAEDLTVGEAGAILCVECATYEYAESDLPDWAS